MILFEYGYCSSFVPKLVKKSEGINDKRIDKSVTRFNYRLTLFTFTSLHWIYEGFYRKVNGVTVKRVPEWIGEYITPLGLAHWIMSTRSVLKEGLILCTQFNDKEDLNKIRDVLINKYKIKSEIHYHEKMLSIYIRNEYLPLLKNIVYSYLDPSFYYLFDNMSFKQSESHDVPTSSSLSSNKVFPVAVYINADVEKELIIKENKAKSGIYRWINKVTGKSYVGSSVSLIRRFNQYYNYNHIADPKRNMAICRALLKYGYSNFQLEILEYCDRSRISLLEREQYYLDLLKPEYNILKIAGSSLGHKHTEQTLDKFRARRLTSEQKVKLQKHLAKLNARSFTLEQRAKIRWGMAKFNVLTKSKKLVFTNVETQEIIKFVSFRDAADKMKISRNTIKKHLNSEELYGKYKITLVDQ